MNRQERKERKEKVKERLRILRNLIQKYGKGDGSLYRDSLVVWNELMSDNYEQYEIECEKIRESNGKLLGDSSEKTRDLPQRRKGR